MTDKIEIQGKTVDAAVSEALLQMGARRDEVEIKVLEEPKSGFLGMLGGRPARVLVRKKRGRRRGGRGRDHRQDQGGYEFGGGDQKSRGGRGRRGGGRRDQDENKRDARGGGRDSGRDGGRDGGRDEGRDGGRRGGRGRGRGRGGEDQNKKQDVRAQDRQGNERRDGGRDAAQGDGERKRTRRGSRGGRGRRGRKPDAAAVDQNQNQNQNASGNQETRREQAPRDDQRGDRSRQRQDRSRRDQRGGGRADEVRQDAGRQESGRQESGRQDAPREERRDDRRSEQREAQRQERSRRDRRPAAAEVARDETPDTRPEAPVAEATSAVRSVSEVHPIRRAGEAQAAVESDTPAEAPAAPAAPAKKRAFGGLGARRKSKLVEDAKRAEVRKAEAEAAEKAAAEAPVVDEGMDSAARRAAERPGEIRRKAAPEGEAPRSAPAPRREARDMREPGDEVIIEGVEATSYARQVNAPSDEAALDTLKELAGGMLARAGFPCDVETRPDEYSQVLISSDEDNAGMLIGRHGQTVEAVEHLVERMASNVAGDRVRMNLDINEYRVRRHESLLERTREAIEDVRESGRAYHMEPMSARERRIVHMGCADEEGIRTFTMMGSRGKQVVIAIDDGSDDESADDAGNTDG